MNFGRLARQFTRIMRELFVAPPKERVIIDACPPPGWVPPTADDFIVIS